MREILFRGKRRDDGEWVYGDLYHRKVCGQPDSVIHNQEYTVGSVVPATIGQYTGCTDVDGDKIFEGGIYNYRGCPTTIKPKTIK